MFKCIANAVLPYLENNLPGPYRQGPSDLDDPALDQALRGIDDRLFLVARAPAEHLRGVPRIDRTDAAELAHHLANAAVEQRHQPQDEIGDAAFGHLARLVAEPRAQHRPHLFHLHEPPAADETLAV